MIKSPSQEMIVNITKVITIRIQHYDLTYKVVINMSWKPSTNTGRRRAARQTMTSFSFELDNMLLFINNWRKEIIRSIIITSDNILQAFSHKLRNCRVSRLQCKTRIIGLACFWNYKTHGRPPAARVISYVVINLGLLRPAARWTEQTKNRDIYYPASPQKTLKVANSDPCPAQCPAATGRGGPLNVCVHIIRT